MSNRIFKVNALIRQELSQIILKELEFPSQALVTLTRVETTNNLIGTKIYVSVIPETEISDVLKVLNHHIYELQQKLNKQLRMRPVPKIKFIEEKKTKEASRIEELLEKLKKEQKSAKIKPDGRVAK